MAQLLDWLLAIHNVVLEERAKAEADALARAKAGR
jgi:hypothetical protein